MSGLLMTLLVMLLAVNLVAPVNSGAALITSATYSTSVVSMFSLYPLLFGIVGIIYIFKQIGDIL